MNYNNCFWQTPSVNLVNIPLLVTSAINVNAPFTILKDPSLRLNLLIDSIMKWRGYFPNIAIVLCDGSGYDFEASEAIKKLIQNDSNFEVLSFLNDFTKVTEFGKGYGEGEIIKYALSHSQKLRGVQHFMKITGRLFCCDFYKSINGMLRSDFSGIALIGYKLNFIPRDEHAFDTRFYVVRRNFYENFLIDAYREVNDKSGNYLEYVFYKKLLMANCLGAKINFLANFHIEGRSGTKNTDYIKPSFWKKELIHLRYAFAICIIKLKFYTSKWKKL